MYGARAGNRPVWHNDVRFALDHTNRAGMLDITTVLIAGGEGREPHG